MFFLRFSTEFTRSGKTHILFKKPIGKEVPESFDFLQIRPQFTLRPSKRLEVLQCGPRGGGRCGRHNSGEAGGLGRAGAGAGRSGGSSSSIWEVGRGGDAAGGGAPRRGRAASARSSTLANGAASAASWDAAGRACDSKEGATSSEDRGVGLRAELGDDGQGATAARIGSWRRLGPRGKGVADPL
jgi:hypothetical protein